jgi:hypothetical protein
LRPGEAPFLATYGKAPKNKRRKPKKAAPFLTLYFQDIKSEGVNPPHLTTLYFHPNERLTKKSSTFGS